MKTISILVLFISVLSYSQNEVEWTPPIPNPTHLEPYDIKMEILSCGIQYPGIVYAQARLETGNFTSSAYKDKHNLFGFCKGGKPITFRTDLDCIGYYYDWQLKHYKGGNYYDFLECLYKRSDGTCVRYASDPEYITKLKQFK